MPVIIYRSLSICLLLTGIVVLGIATANVVEGIFRFTMGFMGLQGLIMALILWRDSLSTEQRMPFAIRGIVAIIMTIIASISAGYFLT
ncbi:MAG: hypothetical protein GFH27_549311n136 [Chloroflexi bacterium AL-W]|nr:hypothetical protein [Chloroflexi bacterium AL-N1]NOK68686.1 hypothetical protein [Chloroflexi bacterium AL-N10]NOK76172.1 hypothetical protein [Chloroflexi bacterium AL-N5]NOK84191.1 hypothetical protein [Chloroflexi bacterium AL-W]NOK91310.1 hypothetical protein [Chloroflexi bacterium AL-N15]